MSSVILPLPQLPDLPHARCRDAGMPDAWFSNDDDILSAAQLVCHRCPERQPCATYAIQHGISLGVWGGLLPHERTQPRHQAAG
jgi:hypothetical protein